MMSSSLSRSVGALTLTLSCWLVKGLKDGFLMTAVLQERQDRGQGGGGGRPGQLPSSKTQSLFFLL